MSIEVSIVQKDVCEVPADLLLLKYARSFHGADQTVAGRLIQRGICTESEISPEEDQGRLVESGGSIAAQQVLFLGTERPGRFRYKQIRQFARRAIEFIAAKKLPVKSMATTVHGAGYGLDIEESLQAMLFGFQQGLAARPGTGLEKITFVEHHANRFKSLNKLIQDVDLVPAPAEPVFGAATLAQVPTEEPQNKKSVFVAMPFQEELDDVYQFGIYAAVRRCGYVCEKVDEAVFAGSIVEQIMEGIRNAEFVIADLTLEKPNVYLEVGYAWGQNKPVIMVAREGQHLHFDLSHHKCIFYRTIGKLSDVLEQTIRDLFGRQP